MNYRLFRSLIITAISLWTLNQPAFAALSTNGVPCGAEYANLYYAERSAYEVNRRYESLSFSYARRASQFAVAANRFDFRNQAIFSQIQHIHSLSPASSCQPQQCDWRFRECFICSPRDLQAAEQLHKIESRYTRWVGSQRSNLIELEMQVARMQNRIATSQIEWQYSQANLSGAQEILNYCLATNDYTFSDSGYYY